MSTINQWNRALVTGASSGIGEEICKQLAAQGTDLVVVARSTDKLEALAEQLEVDVEVLTADLGDRSETAKVATRTGSDTRPIDLLVNCAGFGNFGEFTHLNVEEETEVIEVNVVALQMLCHAAATAMTKRERGWILNVSSIAAYAPYPKSATYGGSKAFVNNFSEALIAELEPYGIQVSYVCPGPTRTNFQARAKVKSDVVPDKLFSSAEDVARTALQGLAKGKSAIVPGAHVKVTKGFIKFLPAALTRKASTFISSKR